MSRKHIVCAVAVLMFAPLPALAAHGKAGLWSSTTTMSMASVPPQTRSATYCMTQAQVNSDTPPANSPDCSYKNVHIDGHAMSADLVCHGSFEATGHFTSTYDGDSHYVAHIAMTTSGMSMTNTIEGKWLKADCAGATQ